MRTETTTERTNLIFDVLPAEHPILFSTEMVKAILEGRKTQTRRIINPQPDNDSYYLCELKERDGRFGVEYNYNQGDKNPFVKCPFGKVGDVLWVRENFNLIHKYPCAPIDHPNYEKMEAIYQVDKQNHIASLMRWKPSIHLKKEHSRIWLQIINIRVQQLRSITIRDISAEGIDCKIGNEYHDVGFKKFESLWKKINGIQSWDANPWVWALTFKVISTTGKPSSNPQIIESPNQQIPQSTNP